MDEILKSIEVMKKDITDENITCQDVQVIISQIEMQLTQILGREWKTYELQSYPKILIPPEIM